MYKKIRRIAARNLVNFRGWRTNRKIVVIESDDWGSIRMPSKQVYNKFLEKGIPVDKSPYCKYDSLASEGDLNALFNILAKYKDSKNNHPVITSNVVVANPDFSKIKESNFNEYSYELITDTFKKYPHHTDCLKIWKKGRDEGVFYPQLHGREHLNVQLWLELLREKHPYFLFAFENGCWGLNSNIYPNLNWNIQASLDMKDRDEIALLKRTVREGSEIFKFLFNYKSRSFIAGNFIWDASLNKTLHACGVKYLQGMKYQKHPLLRMDEREMTRHYLGKKNKFGQYYLIRNCTFEPSQKKENFDNVGECLKDITNAFLWNKPAIITTHRLNFVGHLDLKNRDRNLLLFESLLKNIIKKWPDVEFVTSDQLGLMIEWDSQNNEVH